MVVLNGSVGYFGKPQDSYFKVWLNNRRSFLKLISDPNLTLPVSCRLHSSYKCKIQHEEGQILHFLLKTFLSGKFASIFQTRFRRIIKALNRHQPWPKFLTSLIIDMLPAVIRHAIYIRCLISRGKF